MNSQEHIGTYRDRQKHFCAEWNIAEPMRIDGARNTRDFTVTDKNTGDYNGKYRNTLE
jgi:hypothetical protein